MTSAAPSLSVVVVTYERPDFLRRCLNSLLREVVNLHQVVVVDASNEAQREGREGTDLPLTYVHARELAGWMTRSRNRALLETSGEVIAFLDDDVVVRDGWAASLRKAFTDPTISAVAGRTCNGIVGEESYDQPIGRLLPDGSLSDGFAADPGAVVEIDHGIGANMSFRADVLRRLGGFRDDYPGTALREDTDIFLRIKRLGLRAVFVPDAVVDHLPAPHVKGARFDTRYKLYGRRNHMVLLARHEGVGSDRMRRWLKHQFWDVRQAGSLKRQGERLGVTVAGMAFGAWALAREGHWKPLDPERRDPRASAIRAALERHVP